MYYNFVNYNFLFSEKRQTDSGSNKFNLFDTLEVIILLTTHLEHLHVKVWQPWWEKKKKRMVWEYFDQIEETIEGRLIWLVVCKYYSSCLICANLGDTSHFAIIFLNIVKKFHTIWEGNNKLTLPDHDWLVTPMQ